jgi:hypothetical protein
MQILRANRKSQSAPQDGATKGSSRKTRQTKGKAPQKNKAQAKSSSPESQDSDDQQMRRPDDKTINTFLQGLEDFSPRTGDRFRAAIERCLDVTPSPSHGADHYFGVEDYEDPADEADEQWERALTPPFDHVADEFRMLYGSPRHWVTPSRPRASLSTADLPQSGIPSQRATATNCLPSAAPTDLLERNVPLPPAASTTNIPQGSIPAPRATGSNSVPSTAAADLPTDLPADLPESNVPQPLAESTEQMSQRRFWFWR